VQNEPNIQEQFVEEVMDAAVGYAADALFSEEGGDLEGLGKKRERPR